MDISIDIVFPGYRESHQENSGGGKGNLERFASSTIHTPIGNPAQISSQEWNGEALPAPSTEMMSFIWYKNRNAQRKEPSCLIN